jgi:hypothetical protein
MNYILRFVPLSPNHKIAGVGMAGNIMIVANELLSLKDGDSVWVDMRDYETICGVNKEKSLWGNFFNQIEMPETATKIDLKSRPAHINYYGRYTPNSPIMVKSKEKFFKHFSINDEVKTDISDFYKNNIEGKVTLGCQIRLGDMVNNHMTASLDKYLNRIITILNNNTEIKQVFISTDDEKSIKYLDGKLDVPIVYQKNIYRSSSNDPYERLYDKRDDHNYKLCKEVIIDTFILTKCDYFLRADISSVSIITTMFSENIKEIFFL